MEITKGLKEKLLTANSEEEVNAMPGDQATGEERKRAWYEIKKTMRPAGFQCSCGYGSVKCFL